MLAFLTANEYFERINHIFLIMSLQIDKHFFINSPLRKISRKNILKIRSVHNTSRYDTHFIVFFPYFFLLVVGICNIVDFLIKFLLMTQTDSNVKFTIVSNN